MQYLRKIVYISLLSIFCVFFTKNSFAQYPGMGAFRAQQSRQFVNQQMQQQMMMNGMNWRANAGDGTIYMVKFKDTSTKKVVSYMYSDTILHKNFLVYVDKKFKRSDTLHRYQKIYPDQTSYISTVTDRSSNQETYGVPTDSCWMFKVIDGPLKVYAKSLDYLNVKVVMFISDNEFEPSAIVGIQLNDGPIEKYTKENLIKMVGPNADALQYIENKKYYKAVKTYNHNAEKAAKK